MENDKQDNIEKVYYTHFGSIKQTLAEARKLDPSIKEKDIKLWKDKHLQRKINLSGQNSFVASEPKEEYQMDLFLMPTTKTMDMRKMTKKKEAQAIEQARRISTRRKGEGMALATEQDRSQRAAMATGTLNRGQKRQDEARVIVPKMKKTAEGKYVPQKGLYPFGLLMVDIFTKFMTVVPLKDNKGPALLTGVKKAVREMGGKPQTLYSDGEGGMVGIDATAWLLRKNIRLLSTRTHAHFAERNIRTFKDMVFKRMDHKKIHVDDWQDLIEPILQQYNTKMIHSATGMTPEDAMKPSNEVVVKGRLHINKTTTRRYPPIEVGDKVKIYQKKDKLDKERVSTWSTDVYTVAEIHESHGQDYYKLTPQPPNWKADIQRSEILLIP